MCRSIHTHSAATRKRTVVRGVGDGEKIQHGRADGWIEIDFERKGIVCKRCGGFEAIKLPTLADLLDGKGGRFRERHATCEEQPT